LGRSSAEQTGLKVEFAQSSGQSPVNCLMDAGPGKEIRHVPKKPFTEGNGELRNDSTLVPSKTKKNTHTHNRPPGTE
jgi:hypothetical protein